MTKRKVKEVGLKQGQDETIAYTVTTTPWGSDPDTVSDALYDVTDDDSWTDVSSTKLSGSVSTTGDVITSRAVTSLIAGHKYRLEVKFTVDGNVFECYALIDAEK